MRILVIEDDPTTRKKLSDATGGLSLIETVWGRGYLLRDPEPIS